MACASSKVFGSLGVKVPLRIKQGATFRKYFKLQKKVGSVRTPINITGDSFQAQLRKKPGDPTVVATFNVDIVVGVDGTFFVELLDTVTASIPAGETLDSAKSRYFWDCFWIRSNGDVVPLMHEEVKVLPRITEVSQ